MKWIHTMVHRPALVTVIYLILLIFGGYAYSKLPVDMLPDIEAPVITIVTAYPGASALDVEDKLSRPLEESLGSISNLKTLASTSRENISLVTLVFTSAADIDETANDVRQNLESIKNNLPTDAEDPMVMKFDFGQMPIITFAITTDGRDVRTLTEQLNSSLMDPLRRVPGVGSVFLRNAPDTVLRVDVDGERLLAQGLTFTELAQLIGANNLSIPAGEVEVGKMSFSIRMPGEADSIEALRALPLMASPVSGGLVTLSDVAEVHLALDNTSEAAYANGETAILGYLRKTSDANTVEVTDSALAIFSQAEQELPDGTRIQILEDGASFIKGTITNLQQTVMLGGFLVALIVFLFLRRVGPTFIVAISIPASLVVTFLVVFSFGYTLNSVTLIALSLSIGLVVDNGVVALENISRKIDEGMPKLEAATDGASEVGAALLASTTTTLVIFAPMMFIQGLVGQMFGQLATVMITTVSASLFVALTLTPMLAARLVRPAKNAQVNDAATVLEPTWWERRYVKILSGSLKRPWFTLIGAASIGVATVALLSLLGSDFLPKDDVGQLAFTVELPVGATMDETLSVGELYANELRRQPEVEAVTVRVGTSANGGMGEKEGNNVARVRARLSSAKLRVRSDQEIGDGILTTVGKPPEVVNLEMSRDGSGSNALGATKPIVVEILGNNLEDLEAAAKMIQTEIAKLNGPVNIVTDLVQTKPELQLHLDRNKATELGIPLAQAGQELRIALAGATVSRFSANNTPRDIVLRLAEEDRSQADDWRTIPVRTRAGQLTTLSALAKRSEGESPVQVLRKDKARLLTVSMELNGRSLSDAAADIEQMLATITLPEGISTQIGGAIKDQRESFGDLGLLMGMGLALVYLVMVAQFESWTDPFVIMFSVPFAATGAFLALLISGTNLSVTSFLGLIILIGVVVNNAIVLIDYVKLLRKRGLPLIEAVKSAGQRRLRPVVITTLTTAGGMLPLALTKGEGEQLWGPMGKTALGGLLISSVVTLVLVPTMYVILERFKAKRAKQ